MYACLALTIDMNPLAIVFLNPFLFKYGCKLFVAQVNFKHKQTEMLRTDKCSPLLPPDYERRVRVRDAILDRTIIPNVANLETTDKKLYDFLYHFEQHGWAVYKEMYPVKMVQNVLQEANEFLTKHYEFDMTKPNTYHKFPFEQLGFVDLYHLHSMYDMRFYQPMIELFQKLYNTDQLNVILGAMSFKRSIYEVSEKETKVHEDWGHPGFLHNDCNLITGFTPVPIQCCIALSETTPDMGGWRAISDFHWNATEWARNCVENNYNTKTAILRDTLVSLCPGFPNPDKWSDHYAIPHVKSGDLIVWKAALPHGTGKNVNKQGKPRMAAYVNYVPAGWRDQEFMLDQMECVFSGKHPKGHRDDKKERENYQMYAFTDEQYQLLGVDQY